MHSVCIKIKEKLYTTLLNEGEEKNHISLGSKKGETETCFGLLVSQSTSNISAETYRAQKCTHKVASSIAVAGEET